jgi:hypothetical protein
MTTICFISVQITGKIDDGPYDIAAMKNCNNNTLYSDSITVSLHIIVYFFNVKHLLQN